MHDLVEQAAEGMARRRWRAVGARGYDEARAFYIHALRRRLGVAAVRELARHRIRRAPFVGASRAQVRAHVERRAARAAGGGGLPDAVLPTEFWVYQAYHRAPGAQ